MKNKYLKLINKIHGNKVVSGATRLNLDSIDSLFFSVRPPTDPIETSDDLRIELYRLNNRYRSILYCFSLSKCHSQEITSISAHLYQLQKHKVLLIYFWIKCGSIKSSRSSLFLHTNDSALSNGSFFIRRQREMTEITYWPSNKIKIKIN
jgi:hypothetical protein